MFLNHLVSSLECPWYLKKIVDAPIPDVFEGGYGPTTGRASSEEFWEFGHEKKIWPFFESVGFTWFYHV